MKRSLIFSMIFSILILTACLSPSGGVSAPTVTATQAAPTATKTATATETPSPESLLPQEVKEKFELAGVDLANMENAKYDKDGLHITLDSGEVIVLTNTDLQKGIYNGQDNVLQYRDESNPNAIYAFDKESGKWGVMGTSLSIENLDAKKWGNYSLIENPDGYYEMKDVQGNLIPEVKLFRDGTAELTHEIDGKTENLWIAFQAISVGEEGQLVLGLWEYAEGAWTDAITGIAPKSSEEMKSYHTLVILEGHLKEQAMIETVFLARDQAMTKSEKYDPASEFEDITVTYNFKTVENFDVRPKEWQIVNWSRAENGAFLFRPISPNNEVGYADWSRLAYARPMQIALDMGWFNLDVYGKDGTLQPSTVHIPIIAMNADRSITDLSGVLKQSSLDNISSSFTKEGRGKIWFWLLTQIINTSQYEDFDDELCALIVRTNQNQLEEGWGPKLGNGVSTPDETWKLKSLPKELDRTFLTVFGGQ